MNVKAQTAAEPEADEDLALEADPEGEADAEQGDAEDGEGSEGEPDGEGSEAAAGAEPEEVVVTIGDAEPEADQQEAEVAKAPEWVRQLRKDHREDRKRLRELEAENARLKGGASGQPAQTAAVVLGERPTLASSGYDEEKFAADLEAWHGRKAQIEAQKRAQEQQAEAERKAWEATVAKHNERKAALRVRDYDDAEAVVDELFNPTQQGVLLHVAENSAVLKYALGRNPAKARELAQITDLPKFIAALVRLETQVKTMAKPKTAPLPERVVRGSGALPGSADKTLERLRAEADKTGDRSKVAAYLRQKQAA